MKRRIIIIGSNLNYNLEYFISKAFEKCGHDVKFIGFKNILGKQYREIIRMLASRSYIFRHISSPLWLNKLNETYFEEISSYSPDLVLSIKGETIFPRTIKRIEQGIGVKTALWYPDDPRFFSSLVRHIAPHYDTVFTYSANAIENYKSIGIGKVKRIPFGCDPDFHYNNFNDGINVKRAIFIGTYSPKRYRFIKSLIRADVPIDVAGPYWPIGISKNVISKGLFGKQYVEFLKKYSVVLNMHQNINYGPNMRTFEATGSGGILLSDNAEDISSFFSEREEILTYNDLGDAQRIIKEVLSGDINTKKIAKNAYNMCHMKYTYEQRVKEILM